MAILYRPLLARDSGLTREPLVYNKLYLTGHPLSILLLVYFELLVRLLKVTCRFVSTT